MPPGLYIHQRRETPRHHVHRRHAYRLIFTAVEEWPERGSNEAQTIGLPAEPGLYYYDLKWVATNFPKLALIFVTLNASTLIDYRKVIVL